MMLPWISSSASSGSSVGVAMSTHHGFRRGSRGAVRILVLRAEDCTEPHIQVFCDLRSEIDGDSRDLDVGYRVALALRNGKLRAHDHRLARILIRLASQH